MANDIWERAIIRGMVIECIQQLVEILVPIVLEGLVYVYGVAGAPDALKLENQRRRVRKIRGNDLRIDPRSWTIHNVQGTVAGTWLLPRIGTGQQAAAAPQNSDQKKLVAYDAKTKSQEEAEPGRKRSLQDYFGMVRDVQMTSVFKDAIDRLLVARDITAHPESQVIEKGQQFFDYSVKVLTLLHEEKLAETFKNYSAQLSAVTEGGFRNRVPLEERYPKQYDNDFENAEELWISGTNLRRIITDGKLPAVRRVLEKDNGSVKILMHRPRDEAACRQAMIQEGQKNLDKYRLELNDNLFKFFKLRSEGQNQRKLKIKTINYMLTFGLDVVNGNRNDNSSAAYLRMYPLPSAAGITKIEDKPIVSFRPNEGDWYDFFKQQFLAHWEHDQAEELPLNWDFQAELNFLKSAKKDLS